MQAPDHVEAQLPLSIKYLGHTATRADIGLEVSLSQALLLHAKLVRFDGIRASDGIVLILVLLDQDREHLQLISLRSAISGSPVLLYAGEGAFKIAIILARLTIHQIVSASTLSYWV